ncbi:MAG: glycosyltransferase family 4 protein [Planctomycetes bacterium]|nr:glycosyltransferase family 4 protein [Planctomycetota bacterium]
MSLKVCYVLPRLFPLRSGVLTSGRTVTCSALALEMRRRGIDVEIVAPVAEGRKEFLALHEAAEIIRPLPSYGGGMILKGMGDIHSLRRGLKKWAREARYDVVHSHAGSFPYAAAPLAVRGKRTVRLHSLYCPLGAQAGVYSSWWERPFLARLILNRLDKVVAVTGNVRQSLEQAGISPDKIHLVPMCVDTRRFQPHRVETPSRFFPEGSEGAKVLYVGNGSREKGLVELLHAVRILVEKGKRLFLVATIENANDIEEYSIGADAARELVKELGIEEHVRFLGTVDSIEDLYADSDFMVLPWNTTRGPSDYPMAVLENMAMGKCTVSTPVGGCPELLRNGKAGVLTDGFTPESLAQAMGHVLDHPDVRIAAGEAALEVSASLSVTACTDKMVDLYETLLASRTSSAG